MYTLHALKASKAHVPSYILKLSFPDNLITAWEPSARPFVVSQNHSSPQTLSALSPLAVEFTTRGSQGGNNIVGFLKSHLKNGL